VATGNCLARHAIAAGLVSECILCEDDSNLLTAAGRIATIWSINENTENGSTFEHPEAIVDCSLTDCAGHLLTTCADGYSYLWDVDRHAVVKRFRHSQAVVGAQLERNGQFCVSVDDGTVNGWALPSGDAIFSVPVTAPVACLAIHRAGTQFAVGLEDGQVMVFSALGAPRQSLKHASPVIQATYGQEGNLLAVCCADASMVKIAALSSSTSTDALRVSLNTTTR
jgi:WD40 repeat protein